MKTNKVLNYNNLAHYSPIDTKGKLMRLVFSKKELQNVDSAIPIECWNKVDTSITVMDYNQVAGCFGKLTNLLELAYQRGIEISTKLFNYMETEKWRET